MEQLFNQYNYSHIDLKQKMIFPPHRPTEKRAQIPSILNWQQMYWYTTSLSFYESQNKIAPPSQSQIKIWSQSNFRIISQETNMYECTISSSLCESQNEIVSSQLTLANYRKVFYLRVIPVISQIKIKLEARGGGRVSRLAMDIECEPESDPVDRPAILNLPRAGN